MNSFLIHNDYLDNFEILEDEQLGKLIKHLIIYNKDLTYPVLESKAERIIFNTIMHNMDRERIKYEKKCEANRKNASKGGKAKANKLEEK
jgi:hypothetical protein